ncbi:SafA/ExsA family spore coat assembly protein [Virgibacillus ainsalahensis]
MKIHIVQKGDTLWEISKSYGVDFEQVKELNSHLSSPDMIMPGMKIKIPASSKTVKKESMPIKEAPKKEVKQPYKDMSPKPMPVLEEDDKEKPKAVKPEMPVQPLPQMPIQPIMEQEFQNYTTINLPEIPQVSEVKKEEHKKPKEPAPEQPKMKEQPLPQAEPMPMVPMCCHIIHPCYPPVPFQVMGHVPEGFGHPQPFNPNFHPGPPMSAGPVPMHSHKDCGCNQNMPYPQHQMQPYPVNNTNGYPYQEPAFNRQPNEMYPPQFGHGEVMNSHPYPVPPAYPNFFQGKQEEPKDES